MDFFFLLNYSLRSKVSNIKVLGRSDGSFVDHPASLDSTWKYTPKTFYSKSTPCCFYMCMHPQCPIINKLINRCRILYFFCIAQPEAKFRGCLFRIHYVMLSSLYMWAGGTWAGGTCYSFARGVDQLIALYRATVVQWNKCLDILLIHFKPSTTVA